MRKEDDHAEKIIIYSFEFLHFICSLMRIKK